MAKRDTLTSVWIIFLCVCTPFIACSSVDISSTRVCFGDSTTLANISSVPQTASVEWDLDNDGFFNNGTGNVVKHVFPVADTINVRVKIVDSSGTLFFSLPHPVIVDPNPMPNFYFVGTCFGQNTRLTNTSTIPNAATLIYEWDFDSNTSVDDTVTNPQITFGDTGVWNVTLHVISSDGCQKSMTKPMQIKPTPDAGFIAVPSCNGEISTFINQSTFSGGAIVNRIWKFGDGSLTFSTDTAYHNYPNSGNFDVVLQVTGSNGCSDSLLQTINVDANVSYNYTFLTDSVIYENQTAQIEVTGNFASIVWEDNSISSNRTFTDTGVYNFLVSTSGGCSFRQYITIGRKPSDGPLQRANDFLTPNADGKNDFLYFKNMEQEKPCTLNVYDANGLKVHESSDYQNDWDGTSKGKQVAAGSYYYFLKCANVKEIKGNTNIIR